MVYYRSNSFLDAALSPSYLSSLLRYTAADYGASFLGGRRKQTHSYRAHLSPHKRLQSRASPKEAKVHHRPINLASTCSFVLIKPGMEMATNNN